MTEPPDSHAFPATTLGAFLRAMEDPEGTGNIDEAREREIAKIEQRITESRDSTPDDDGCPR